MKKLYRYSIINMKSNTIDYEFYYTVYQKEKLKEPI